MRATASGVCARSVASRRIRAANGRLNAGVARPTIARTIFRRVDDLNHSLANAFLFSLNRYISEGDEAAAASGSDDDDDDDAEEEEVVEEEDAASREYKIYRARCVRVTLSHIA